MAEPVILTVDDEPQVLNAVNRDLRQHYRSNYRIMKAGSGAEALEAVERLSVKIVGGPSGAGLREAVGDDRGDALSAATPLDAWVDQGIDGRVSTEREWRNRAGAVR